MKRKRTTRNPVIDTHAHWYPRQFITLLQQEAADNGAAMAIDKRGNPVFSLPVISQKSIMVPPMIEPELMLKNMNDRRVDIMAVSLTNPMVYWAPPKFGLKLSRTWNDACAELHTAYPDRFLGTMMLPMQAPKLALKELDRAAKLPGMKALYLAEAINGRNLHEKDFWPIYKRCEELRLPVFLHSLYPCGQERMGEFFMRNTLGNPYEAGIAASCLVLGGVLDAFPKLQVMLPHAGGTFPWLVGRIDFAQTVRAELAHRKRPTSQYLWRFHYDTITHHGKILSYLVDLVGADRIVLGSDYNQDMCDKDPVHFIESIPSLTAAQRQAILSANARKLLKL